MKTRISHTKNVTAKTPKTNGRHRLLPAFRRYAMARGSRRESKKSLPWVFEDLDGHVPEWEDLPGKEQLQAWAHELRAARTTPAKKAAEKWKLTGRYALIVGDDPIWISVVLAEVAAEAGMRFAEVEPQDVAKLTSLAPLRKQGPVLLHLKGGDWMLEPDDDMEPAAAAERSALHERMDGLLGRFDPARPVVIVVSVEEIYHMVVKLRRVGRFDRFLRLAKLSPKDYGELFIARVGEELCDPSIIDAPHKVGQLVRTEFEQARRVELAALCLQRLAAKSQRLLEFLDLTHLVSQGFGESSHRAGVDDPNRRHSAVHEAGHVVVAICDSAGKNTPDYASVLPGAKHAGLVMDSLEYVSTLDDHVTYAAFQHKVRVFLAGRAAEEVVYGVTQISSGSRSDLEGATGLAADSFAKSGFAPDMSDESQSAVNLAVTLSEAENDLPFHPTSATSAGHVESLVRQFLATEYAAVRTLLVGSRPFLDAVTEALLAEEMVDQRRLREIAAVHRAGGEKRQDPGHASPASAQGNAFASRSTHPRRSQAKDALSPALPPSPAQ